MIAFQSVTASLNNTPLVPVDIQLNEIYVSDSLLGAVGIQGLCGCSARRFERSTMNGVPVFCIFKIPAAVDLAWDMLFLVRYKHELVGTYTFRNVGVEV